MIIYKYLDVKGAEETVKNRTVLLRNPDKYNDPFDCLFYVSDKERKKAFRLFMNYEFFKALYSESVVKNKQSKIGKANTVLMKKNLILLSNSIKKTKKYCWDPYIDFWYKMAKNNKPVNDEEIKAKFDSVMDTVFDSIRSLSLVSCFSLQLESITMWSHYADKHKGVCIEYEIDDEHFEKVHYSKKLPTFKLSKIMQHILGCEFSQEKMEYDYNKYHYVLAPIFTKSTDWKNEAEVRCVYSLDKKNPNIVPGKIKDEDVLFLKMDNIKRIFLGCKSDASLLKKIKKHSGDIPIYKMKMKKGEYGLEIDKAS